MKVKGALADKHYRLDNTKDQMSFEKYVLSRHGAHLELLAVVGERVELCLYQEQGSQTGLKYL